MPQLYTEEILLFDDSDIKLFALYLCASVQCVAYILSICLLQDGTTEKKLFPELSRTISPLKVYYNGRPLVVNMHS